MSKVRAKPSHRKYQRNVAVDGTKGNILAPYSSPKARNVTCEGETGEWRGSNANRQAEVNGAIWRVLTNSDQALRGKREKVVQCLSCDDLTVLCRRQ